jgi:hypothetical protein
VELERCPTWKERSRRRVRRILPLAALWHQPWADFRNASSSRLLYQETKRWKRRLAPTSVLPPRRFSHRTTCSTRLGFLSRPAYPIGAARQRFHDLRNDAAPLMHANGDDHRTIMANLGHSTIWTTAHICAHVAEETQRLSADRMGVLLARRG